MRNNHYRSVIEVPNNFYWQLFLPVIKLASLLPGLGCFIIGLVLWENTDISFLTLFPSYMDVLSLRLLLPLAFSKMDDKKSSHFEKDRGPQSISRVWAFCIKSEGKEDTYVESRMGSLWIRPQLLPRFCELAKLLQLYHIACNRQATLSTGFSRQEYWSGLPGPPPYRSHSTFQNVVASFSHFLLWPLNPFHIQCTDWLGNEDV